MKFNYQARTKKGRIQSGTIEASSRKTALVLLQRNKLFITVLEEVGSIPFYIKKVKIFERISRKEVVMFSRQLSIMFKSKVSLVESLRVLTAQIKNPAFREKVLKISEQVEGGTSFSQAISSFPKVFSPFYISMVKSGEASGTLSESLNYLADHLEREYHLYSKITGALMYPALIVVMMLGILILMTFFVIPQLTSIFEGSEQNLPFITKVVISFSNFLINWWWLILIGLVGLGTFVYQ